MTAGTAIRSAGALRRVELTVRRRLDGLLQGDHTGVLLGAGSDHGEARVYVAGDDVRRIDWAVSARTGDVHVRDTIADRELELTLVVDTSASLGFGTAHSVKRDVAWGAAVAFAVLATRGGNRVGALLPGRDREWIAHRSGDTQLATLTRALERTPAAGALALADQLRRGRLLAVRRGLVVVVSDFLDRGPWARELRGLARRHDVVAVEVVDPRELELPDVGTLLLEDPETGRRRRADTSRPALRERFAAAAADQRAAIAEAITGAGASHLVLRTDRDWLADTVRFVVQRRRGGRTARRP